MRLEKKYLPSGLVNFMRGKARTAFYQYALVAALVAVVCVTALLALGKSP